jgi:hypothetical protein
VYDVFILGLTIAGISAVVVFSYKIFHSRVYPVGMVRRIPAIQECEDATTSILPNFETPFEQDELIKAVIVEGFSDKELARDLNLSAADIKDYLQRTRGLWSKRTLKGQVQVGLRHYRLGIRHNLEQNPFHEREDSPLKKEPVEHAEALKLHSKLEDFEKRIRRLEIESLEKFQEATEEKPQSPQVVH